MADANTSSVASDIGAELLLLTREIQELYLLDRIPWVIGYSGGKDSTAVLQLVWWALHKLPAEQRTKKVYVISTDTLVESPVVSAWVRASLARMRAAANSQGLPFEPHQLTPEVSDTFWVNLIGRGYPAPRHMFRWCTERLKILPSNRFIRQVVRDSGEAILVLGTRRAESAKRAATFRRHDVNRVRDKLSPNSKLSNSQIYTPIEHWSNDDVWLYLMQVPNPWGHSNRDLLTMYRGASADNECPLVVDTSTPSCGNSRFGCWVCTMVERDRSMEAMIQNDQEKEWMMPLLEIRNELDLQDDRDRRDFRRMNGRVQLFNNEPIHGPYTKEWREHWLRRVLSTQAELRDAAPPNVGEIELIRPEELREIRRIWLQEKHEFDDSLPRIYQECMGVPFAAETAELNALGPSEWEVLEEVSGDDRLDMELVAHLLSTEQQYRTMARRNGIYSALEDVLRNRGYSSREEAVAEAREKSRGRQAIEPGRVEEQLDLLRSAARPSRSS